MEFSIIFLVVEKHFIVLLISKYGLDWFSKLIFRGVLNHFFSGRKTFNSFVGVKIWIGLVFQTYLPWSFQSIF